MTDTAPIQTRRRGRGARGEGRAALLAATQHLIATEGVGGVRLRPVAACAGLSLGSTTYHFPDRADLIDDALTAHTTAIELRTAAAMSTTPTQLDAAPSAISAALEDVYANRSRAAVTVELKALSIRNDHARELAHRVHTAIRAMLTRAPGVTEQRQQIITDLDAAAIDFAGEHHSDRDFARAMRQRITAALSD